jgi:hemerythrin-like metal-binding protein
MAAMALLEWKEEYATGIDDVDDEHKDLIDVINRLHELLLADDAKLTVPAFFARLIDGVSAHFALEERIMGESAYPDREAHRADHERLLDEMRDLVEAFRQAEEVDSVDLAMRLEPWFSQHFATHDLRLHTTLKVH